VLEPGAKCGDSAMASGLAARTCAAALHVRRGRRPVGDQVPYAGADAFGPRGPAAFRRQWPGQAVQVRRGVGIEAQCVRDAVQDLGGGVLVAALFEAQVVLDADPGQQRDLLAA
jgi:hypothetical protein